MLSKFIKFRLSTAAFWTAISSLAFILTAVSCLFISASFLALACFCSNDTFSRTDSSIRPCNFFTLLSLVYKAVDFCTSCIDSKTDSKSLYLVPVTPASLLTASMLSVTFFKTESTSFNSSKPEKPASFVFVWAFLKASSCIWPVNAFADPSPPVKVPCCNWLKIFFWKNSADFWEGKKESLKEAVRSFELLFKNIAFSLACSAIVLS